MPTSFARRKVILPAAANREPTGESVLISKALRPNVTARIAPVAGWTCKSLTSVSGSHCRRVARTSSCRRRSIGRDRPIDWWLRRS